MTLIYFFKHWVANVIKAGYTKKHGVDLVHRIPSSPHFFLLWPHAGPDNGAGTATARTYSEDEAGREMVP